jgi:polysaccharide biosynthesis protein PelG
VSVETGFYERYIVFYRAIQQHATFAEIRRNHQEIVQALVMGGRNIAVVEGVICYLALLVAPGLIGLAKGGLELVPIFRFGVLGVFFHTLLLFAIVIASYFDLRKITFQVTLVFLLTNALLTAIFLPMGAAYAGYGYFLASLITFLFAYLSVSWCVKRLPYMTFIGNNPGLH